MQPKNKKATSRDNNNHIAMVILDIILQV